MSNAKTLASYEENSEEYIDSRSPDESVRYTKWITDELKDFPKDISIFEIGTGPGYDADYLESLGYSINRSDAASSFIFHNEKLGHKIIKFNVITDEFSGVYDVIFAVNVMQHLTLEEFRRAIYKISNALSDDGRFLFSITTAPKSIKEWHDDKGGARYFRRWSLEELVKELEKAGFFIKKQYDIGYKNWWEFVAEKKVVEQ